jgi:hypothetical protein
LKLREKKLGRQHPDTQRTVANLGVNYKDAGRLPEALPLLEEAFQSAKTIPSLRGIGPALLDGYGKAGKTAEAAIPRAGGGDLRIPEALDRLIELSTATNKPDEAKKWRAERAKYPEANKPVAPAKK